MPPGWDRAVGRAPFDDVDNIATVQHREVRVLANGIGQSRDQISPNEGQWLLAYSELVRSWWHDNFKHRPNHLRFSRTTYLSNGGVPDRHFAFGAWECAEDEALVVEFRPPECEQWILQLCNIWHENLDNYEDGQGYINKFMATPEADGVVRVVVSGSDPGAGPNWVDPYGHARGIMGLRFIKALEPPVVTVYRLPLEALRRDGWAALKSAIVYEGDQTD